MATPQAHLIISKSMNRGLGLGPSVRGPWAATGAGPGGIGIVKLGSSRRPPEPTLLNFRRWPDVGFGSDEADDSLSAGLVRFKVGKGEAMEKIAVRTLADGPRGQVFR